MCLCAALAGWGAARGPRRIAGAFVRRPIADDAVDDGVIRPTPPRAEVFNALTTAAGDDQKEKEEEEEEEEDEEEEERASTGRAAPPSDASAGSTWRKDARRAFTTTAPGADDAGARRHPAGRGANAEGTEGTDTTPSPSSSSGAHHDVWCGLADDGDGVVDGTHPGGRSCSGRGTLAPGGDPGRRCRCHCAFPFTGAACEEEGPGLRCNFPFGAPPGRPDDGRNQVATRCFGACDKLGKCRCGRGAYPGRELPYNQPAVLAEALKNTERPGQSSDLWGEFGLRVPAVHAGTWSADPVQSPGWCDVAPENVSVLSSDAYEGARYWCLGGDVRGALCHIRTMPTCVNDCAGHGACRDGGSCACDRGWGGVDCSAPVAVGAGLGGGEGGRTDAHLPGTTRGLAAEGEDAAGPRRRSNAAEGYPRRSARRRRRGVTPPHSGGHRRAAVYVYDLPPEFNVHLLQQRMDPSLCQHRSWMTDDELGEPSGPRNGWGYGAETGLHEALLNSPHRVFDPELADVFYLPIYGACVHFLIGRSPDWHAGLPSHAVAVTYFYKAALDWVRREMPFWNRTGGADHLVPFFSDEGACYAPQEARNATLLVHWGNAWRSPVSTTRYDEHRWDVRWTPNLGFERWFGRRYLPPAPVVGSLDADSWSFDLKRDALGDYPCYDPGKDLVLPAMVPWDAPLGRNQILDGDPPVHPESRTTLLFYAGNLVGHKRMSLGIRQTLTRLGEGAWRNRSDVVVGSYKKNYHDMLSSSVFCAVVPGHGYSKRMEESMINGCVPVLVQDGVHEAWENVMDYDAFSIRVRQADLHRMVDILEDVPAEVLAAKRREAKRVWRRFTWSSVHALDKKRRIDPAAVNADRIMPLPRASEDSTEEESAGDAVDTLLLMLTVMRSTSAEARRREHVPSDPGPQWSEDAGDERCETWLAGGGCILKQD